MKQPEPLTRRRVAEVTQNRWATFRAAGPGERLYTARFFLLFSVSTFFQTGFTLQFHFGQYVEFLGGGEAELGWVLGIGVLGSLLIRPFVGRFIDDFGSKPALCLATGLAMLAAFAYPFTRSLVLVCLLRLLTMMAAATFLTAVTVLAARIAPPRRRAESLGTIGLGGLAGMMLGPTLGDFIFSHGTTEAKIYHVFFSCAAGSLLVATLLALLLHDCDSTIRTSAPSGSTVRVVLRHWPGWILAVGVAFAMSLTIHFSFLERMAEFRGFANIKYFFLSYCPTAMVLRLVFRRAPERFGRRRTCTLGVLLFGAGMALLATAYSELGLVLPAMVMGAGHCFIFPSMVDLAAEKLPHESRGVGTSLILGAGDLGFLIGNILWGQLIEARGYDATLLAAAGVAFATAAVYAWSERAIVFRRGRLPHDPSPR